MHTYDFEPTDEDRRTEVGSRRGRRAARRYWREETDTVRSYDDDRPSPSYRPPSE